MKGEVGGLSVAGRVSVPNWGLGLGDGELTTEITKSTKGFGKGNRNHEAHEEREGEEKKAMNHERHERRAAH